MKMRAANGPACESSNAAEEASSSRNKARWQKPSTAWDAARCQPRVSVVKLWLVSNERTGHLSKEQVVPGRGFKANGEQQLASSLKWQRLRQRACSV